MNTSSAVAAAPAANPRARLSSLALAVAMTLAMLGSVNILATPDTPDAAAPQMATSGSTSRA